MPDQLTNAQIENIVRATVAQGGGAPGAFDKVWEKVKEYGDHALKNLTSAALEGLVRKLMGRMGAVPVAETGANYGGGNDYDDFSRGY